MDSSCNCDKCELKGLFFHSVSEEELVSVCNNKKENEHQKGDVIIEEGALIEDFIYLKSGLVKLYKTSGNQEQILKFAGPFDFVSILNIFSNSKYQYSVQALEDSVTCHVKFNEVRNMVLENGVFAHGLLQKMGQVSDDIIQESLEIRRHNLKGRVAIVLLYFADRVYESNEFELPLSRKEIAEYIGKTTENVIRALSDFKKSEIIKIYGKSIEIIDKNMLIQLSKFG
jgi:CRP/FNR family transcriptional regulator